MRAFGFACCERAVGAAEGINVLLERKVDGKQGPEYIYNVTNLEYTEFEKYGFTDECAEGSGVSRYPANTNVLYVSLKVRHKTLGVLLRVAKLLLSHTSCLIHCITSCLNMQR